MTRDQALQRLADPAPVGYVELDGIFQAFGFSSRTPDWRTEVYFHPTWKTCGLFTAHDDGLHVLTAGQRTLIGDMIRYILFCEAATTRRSPPLTTKDE